MQPNPVFAPPTYPVGYHPAHPAMPMVYVQHGHQPVISGHHHPAPMHMHQPPHSHPQPNLAPQQFYPAQGGHPNNNSNNTQRFPPAKRPRFDNNRPSGPTPSSSFNSNAGPGQSNNGSSRQPEPPTVGPPLQPSHPPLPPPPQANQPQNIQTHGRFPPQQPAFKGKWVCTDFEWCSRDILGRGGGGPSSSSRGRGSSRGGATGRGGSGNSGTGRGASGRGGSR